MKRWLAKHETTICYVVIFGGIAGLWALYVYALGESIKP